MEKVPINLLRGWPAPALLPIQQISGAANDVLSDPGISTPGLLYGPDEGYGPLRAALSTWLSKFYSVSDDLNRICITGGASQNLACALQVFTDPAVTKAIWMVAPCYFLASRIFEDAGFAGRLRAVAEDSEGIDIEYLEGELVKMGDIGATEPKFKPIRPWSKFYNHVIYAVPTFSNPSGKTMSLLRRQQLVKLARKYNALVITDDVYDHLQWPTTNASCSSSTRALLPRLSDIDRELEPHHSDPNHFGHTMSNGSFSKILGPGVRTGWADSMPALSYALSQCGSSRSGGCPSQLTATMVSQLVANGELQKHITTVLCPAYQKRWRLMMDTIETELVPLGIKVSRNSLRDKDTFGGYFIWFQLPDGMKAENVASRAKEKEELIVAHGGLFEVYGDEESVRLGSYLRVCFAWESESKLIDSIERLGRVIGAMIKAGDVSDEMSISQDSEGLREPMGEI